MTGTPTVQGRCPACSRTTLILGVGGYVTCSHLDCPDPAAAGNLLEQPLDQLTEARFWARHGYEIGQRHCGWTDHGVAPAWLTGGWPTHIDACEHSALLAGAEQRIAAGRRIHRIGTMHDVVPGQAAYCVHCRFAWPCPTARALDGQEAHR
ncbi:MAG: DUF6085 family protein [Gaiellaceae bacterium]